MEDEFLKKVVEREKKYKKINEEMEEIEEMDLEGYKENERYKSLVEQKEKISQDFEVYRANYLEKKGIEKDKEDSLLEEDIENVNYLAEYDNDFFAIN